MPTTRWIWQPKVTMMVVETNNKDKQNDHQQKKGMKQVWQKKVPVVIEKTPKKEEAIKGKEALQEEATTSKERTIPATPPVKLPNNSSTCGGSKRDETPTSIPLLQLLQYVAILVTHRYQAS